MPEQTNIPASTEAQNSPATKPATLSEAEAALGKDGVEAAVSICKAMTVQVALATLTSPIGGLPAGELYAKLNAHGMTLSVYQMFERIIIKSGMVRKENDLLIINHKLPQ